MKHYSLESIDSLIERYVDKGGQLWVMVEGTLGHGTSVLFAPPEANLKFVVIQERFQNSWSSTHTIRMYNKMPKKYELWLEKIENKEN